ncbi:hypothetical protein ON010_g3336 [Phytophthora cinnamomi]|nr:hypothetical protein ON010_g3336 [Phytophthora cinnamomi]
MPASTAWTTPWISSCSLAHEPDDSLSSRGRPLPAPPPGESDSARSTASPSSSKRGQPRSASMVTRPGENDGFIVGVAGWLGTGCTLQALQLGLISARGVAARADWFVFVRVEHTNSIDGRCSSEAPMAPKNPRIIALFDVDGTLTAARKTATPRDAGAPQEAAREHHHRRRGRLGPGQAEGAARRGRLARAIPTNLQNLKSQYSNEQINRLVNFALRYIADLDIPVKRGTFVEFRMGMINVSPIGRNCSQEERDDFEKYDHIHKIRETFVEKLRAEFPDYNLTFSIGGQGWDKTFCLRYLDAKDYDEIHFFGDKTHKGGNDYEIYTSDRTIGHSVKNPEETIQILDQLFP